MGIHSPRNRCRLCDRNIQLPTHDAEKSTHNDPPYPSATIGLRSRIIFAKPIMVVTLQQGRPLWVFCISPDEHITSNHSRAKPLSYPLACCCAISAPILPTTARGPELNELVPVVYSAVVPPVTAATIPAGEVPHCPLWRRKRVGGTEQDSRPMPHSSHDIS